MLASALFPRLEEALSARLVKSTKLADPAYRASLWKGGKPAIDASRDPMIVYAHKIDANDRALEKQFDGSVDGPTTAAQPKLADARFAAYGNTLYPDATFSLRVSYGKVLGWIERGKPVPTRTLIGGTYERATGAEPFDLPAAFIARRAKIDRDVTYDFVTTRRTQASVDSSVFLRPALRGFFGADAGPLPISRYLRSVSNM